MREKESVWVGEKKRERERERERERAGREYSCEGGGGQNGGCF